KGGRRPIGGGRDGNFRHQATPRLRRITEVKSREDHRVYQWPQDDQGSKSFRMVGNPHAVRVRGTGGKPRASGKIRRSAQSASAGWPNQEISPKCKRGVAVILPLACTSGLCVRLRPGGSPEVFDDCRTRAAFRQDIL